MGRNYLFIPKLQRCNRWSLGRDDLFHPTLYWACDYSSMQGLKSIHVNKRGLRPQCVDTDNLRVTCLTVYGICLWWVCLSWCLPSGGCRCLRPLGLEWAASLRITSSERHLLFLYHIFLYGSHIYDITYPCILTLNLIFISWPLE